MGVDASALTGLDEDGHFAAGAVDDNLFFGAKQRV